MTYLHPPKNRSLLNVLRTKGRSVFISKQKRNLIIFQNVFQKFVGLEKLWSWNKVGSSAVIVFCWVVLLFYYYFFCFVFLVIPDSWVFKLYCLCTNKDPIRGVEKKTYIRGGCNAYPKTENAYLFSQ